MKAGSEVSSPANAADDIELLEYGSRKLARDTLDEDTALAFLQRFAKYVSLDFPTPANAQQWVFTAKDTVGYFPLDASRAVRVLPKVRVHNVLGMLERAYDLPISILNDSANINSLNAMFHYLAGHLAQLVLSRAKRGLAKAYQARHDDLPYVRGRIDVATQLRRPVAVRFACDYQEHSFDIHDNHVLRWTLLQLSRARLREPAKGRVRLAQHTLASVVSLLPVHAHEAVAPYYDRLRQDYRPMHALCRLFLDSLTPTLARGQLESVPLLISMPKLFERYVFAVLRDYLRDYLGQQNLRVRQQVPVPIGHGVSFQIDIVIEDASGQTLLVLDTKYKDVYAPSSNDVQQVVAYAEAMGCTQAALVYPTLTQPMTLSIGRKQVHRLELNLGGDLPEAAKAFCEACFEACIVDGHALH